MEGSFRFIHCSDLHLGCGFDGISGYDEGLANKLAESTFIALDKIVEESKNQNVDFVIFSGDIFNSTTESPLTRSRFVKAVEEIGVPCYICWGNHDYRRSWEDSIPLPANAMVFPDELGDFVYEKDGKQIARLVGASFSSRHTSADLTEKADGYGDVFTIGVFHCNLDTVSSDDDYAPCKLSNLLNKQIQYWALGHIHKREIVYENPHVVYSGNTQGRRSQDIGEKGAFLVSVRDGLVEYMKFFRTGPILWDDVEIDITSMESVQQIINAIVDTAEAGSLLHITLRGRNNLDNILRLNPKGVKELIETGTGCLVTKLEIKTRPDIDLEKREDTGDFVSAVINYGNKLFAMSRKELLEIICFTTTAQSISERFDNFTDDELRGIVRDAMFTVIEKMMEAEK